MECIVLAGGLGTRLRSVTQDLLPKCMATITEKPFLYYLLRYLETQSVTQVTLALGHKATVVLDWLKEQNFNFKTAAVIEEEPLGTGGAIQLATQKTQSENVIVLNGDTLFCCDLKQLYQFHLAQKAATTIGLKEMYQYDRYGSVVTASDFSIQSFEEKQYKESGFINAGVYVINREMLLQKNLPQKFSFEKDYLEAFVHEKNFFAQKFNDYFIDIGIPEDYQKAQLDFAKMFV